MLKNNFSVQGFLFSSLIFLTSLYASFSLFSAVKFYNIHNMQEHISSPHVTRVSARLDFSPIEKPSLLWRILIGIRWIFLNTWRFFIGSSGPATPYEEDPNVSHFQRLNVWCPGEFELHFFPIYSPVHSLLWLAMNGTNWILISIIMLLVGFQV